MRRILATLAAGLTAAGLLSATAVPVGAEEPPTIVGLVIATSGAPGAGFDDEGNDYDILRDAVVATDLVDPLSAGNWTVFAPNDRAFGHLYTDLTGTVGSEEEVFALIASLGLETVQAILLSHVVPESALSRTEVTRSRSLLAASGFALHVRGVTLLDAEPSLANPKIVPPASDIHASNGVIHTIDRVILPIDL